MEVLGTISSFGIVGDSNLSEQMSYQARQGQLSKQVFDRQTIANARRRIQSRTSEFKSEIILSLTLWRLHVIILTAALPSLPSENLILTKFDSRNTN